MTTFETTALIFMKALLREHPDHIQALESYIVQLKESLAHGEYPGEGISYREIFISFFTHIFSHHPEIKLSLFALIEQSQASNNTSHFDQEKIYFADWAERAYSLPVPHTVKRQILYRNRIEDATWIETGTAWGDMTLFLSFFAPRVFSIEPFFENYNRAMVRLKEIKHIELINGTSQEVLPSLLEKVNGKVCFFLDGHYSGEGTYLGKSECPLIDELFLIRKNMDRYDHIMVAIDDLNACYERSSDSSYPSLQYFIAWAQDANLKWHIEPNMFIARR